MAGSAGLGRVSGSVLGRLGVVLAVVGLGVFLPSASAHAHATLVSTSPARGAVLATSPAEVVLTFTEPVRLVADRVKVVDPTGARVDQGQPRVESRTLRIPLRPGGPRGTYLVSFRVTSVDSHPVGGSFSYSVGAPSGPGSVTADETSNSGAAVALPVVRGVGYAGLALLVGAALVLSLVWPRRLDRRGAVRALWAGAVVVAVTSMLEVLLEIWYVSGALADVGGSQARYVLLGQYGAAHAVRLGLAIGAPLLLRPLLSGGSSGTTRVVAVVTAVVGLATWPASGHPVASPVPALSLVADLTHVAAMSVWLGGLTMLAVFLLPRANATELAGIVPVWSRWALLAVSVLLATGVIQALIEVASVDALLTTTYGWLVAAKVGLLAGVLALAWQSRRLVPRIAEQAGRAAAQLRGLVLVEATGIAVILVVASVLVQTPPARSAEAAAESGQAPTGSMQTAFLSNELYHLAVEIVPARVGLNDVRLYAYTLEGRPADVKEWRAIAAPSNQDIEPVRADMLRITADRAVGQLMLPTAGPWQLTLTLRTSEIDQASVTATVFIAE